MKTTKLELENERQREQIRELKAALRVYRKEGAWLVDLAEAYEKIADYGQDQKDVRRVQLLRAKLGLDW